MYGFKLLIEGDRACFTRPEMKVERVSYDVPTPSALEGLIKSVYWKPAIRYCIDKIVVFRPIRFMNVRRNEVKNKAACHIGKDNSLYTDECRSQRATMMLKDVKYGVEFHFEMTGLKSDHEDELEAKHYNILKRRLENGQYFRTPCLGCSEFPVRSMRLVNELPLAEISSEIRSLGDVDLGYMLYDLQFTDGGKPLNGDWDHPQFSDRAEARYYRPHMIGGIIDVAHYKEAILC
jgi:CRISPR-associated protein Cas5d